MNFVMTAGDKIVELQAAAENQVFDNAQLAKMMSPSARHLAHNLVTAGTAGRVGVKAVRLSGDGHSDTSRLSDARQPHASRYCADGLAG